MRAQCAVMTLALLLLSVAGCGGGGGGSGGSGGMGGGHHHHGGTTGSGATAGSGGGTAGTNGTGGDSGPPQAPIMESVEPMEGALHVTWTNNTPDCEKIELDRNKDGGAYANAYTLIGTATEQHDDAAIPPGTYCYKARCIKGAETSPDSNEKCGTP